MVRWEPIKSGTDCRNTCSRFCNPEATGRQTVTTMRANCNHELSQPGLLIWEESRRSECNFRRPAAQKHIANPVRWAARNRVCRIPDAHIVFSVIVFICSAHQQITLAGLSIQHTFRQFFPNDHHPYKTTTNQSTNKGIVRMHPAQPSRDTRLWICSMGCKWEVNGIGIGGHYVSGVAARRQTCNAVHILSGSCATARISAKQKLAKWRRHCSSIDS